MNGDHLAGGVFAPCVCCMPGSVRLMQKNCVYDARIVHVGNFWWSDYGPPRPDGWDEKYFASYRISWTGTMSFFKGTGPENQPNTDGYSGTASLDYVEASSTGRVWHAINNVPRNFPPSNHTESGSTSRTSTPIGTGWTPPPNGTAPGFSGYTMRIRFSPYNSGYFTAASSSGGIYSGVVDTWVMAGATGTVRRSGFTKRWNSPDNIIREEVTWECNGAETWADEIMPAEVSAAIGQDVAEPPPWEDIEAGVALSTSDMSSWFLRVPVFGHEVGVPYIGGPFDNYGWIGPSRTFSRARHYFEFKDWGVKAARVTWQTRARGGAYNTWWWEWDEWGEWGEERSARLALRSVEIDQGSGPEKWLRSDPLPEDPLPEDYMVQIQRQIRILSIAAA